MPHRDLHIDFNHSIDPQGKCGVSEEDLEEVAPFWAQARQALLAMHQMGQVQFMHLPYLDTVIQEVQEGAQALRQKFDSMVVLGMGGAALGTRAIQQACGDLEDTKPSLEQKNVEVLDTLDPAAVAAFLTKTKLERTVFNVVSKSGNTVETMSQFLFFYDLLKKRLGEEKFRKHFVVTTDPSSGALRRLVEQEGLKSFPILKGVGSRFSVLSPVGLLPAAFSGVSIRDLVAGAAHMDKRCRLADLWTNPAAMLAVVTFLLHKKYGKNQWVLWNYAESFHGAVHWFCQLWAESLAKRVDTQGNVVFSGVTPLPAQGPRDQHSQMQLYTEGPRDKMVMFIQQDRVEQDFIVPPLFQDLESLHYLGGKSFSEILLAEILATEQALKETGTPSCKLYLYGSDAYTLGQFFYLMQVTTAYVGALMNVNPYDQPGVELGKKYLYGKLGRIGFESHGGVLARKIKEKRYIV